MSNTKDQKPHLWQTQSKWWKEDCLSLKVTLNGDEVWMTPFPDGSTCFYAVMAWGLMPLVFKQTGFTK